MLGMYLFVFGYPIGWFLCLIGMWRIRAERKFISLTVHKGFFKAVVVSLLIYFGLVYALVYGLGPYMFDGTVSKEIIDARCAQDASMMNVMGIMFWPWIFAVHYELWSRERIELLVPDEA